MDVFGVSLDESRHDVVLAPLFSPCIWCFQNDTVLTHTTTACCAVHNSLFASHYNPVMSYPTTRLRFCREHTYTCITIWTYALQAGIFLGQKLLVFTFY